MYRFKEIAIYKYLLLLLKLLLNSETFTSKLLENCDQMSPKHYPHGDVQIFNQ